MVQHHGFLCKTHELQRKFWRYFLLLSGKQKNQGETWQPIWSLVSIAGAFGHSLAHLFIKHALFECVLAMDELVQ